MRQFLIIILLSLLFFDGFGQEADTTKVWQIDSIQIKKNWRTRDKIIIRELKFSAGEKVDQSQLETSISQIWNIGSFTQVGYSIDTIKNGSHLLNITAKDAFNLVPYVTFNGNKDDRNISMGFSDKNFLGRNINLDLQGNIGTYKSNYNASVRIPRQLLYKNMTLSFQISSGSGNSYRYENNKKNSAVAYRVKQFSGSIGNPFHTDYSYTFSPNFSWNLFQHNADTSLINLDVPLTENYKINYLAFSVGESIGLINRVRHQYDGYSISVRYGIGIGLDKNSPVYQSVGFGASCYKTLNRVVELSAAFSTGYTTTTIPSLITYMSSGNIKGLINGQESGQGYYNAKFNCSFTYLYYDWFALEHSFYSHFGKANDHYFEIYKEAPRFSLGTEIRIWTPMIPWLSASVHFTWIKGNNNWLHLNI